VGVGNPSLSRNLPQATSNEKGDENKQQQASPKFDKKQRKIEKENSANFSLRIGTVVLPKQLEERIYSLLKGKSPFSSSTDSF
jgi:hypothetical protein